LNDQLKLVLHLGVHNVLPDNFIYGVLEDKNGNYWLSHNKGLSCFDINLQQFIHYNVLDGLQSNEFNTGAFYKDDEGILYFGGVNGVNEIIPEKIFKNLLPPQIAIHQILIDDEPFNGDTAANELSVLNLSFKRNTFSLDFASLDFSIPEKNQYAYFLQGIDKDWIYSGSRHFLRYANLPPGNYTLFLKASNADGIWSSPRILKIIVHPPFWQKAWFYFLEGFLFIAIISFIILFIRRNQKLKYQRELAIREQIERERIRISRDLHDHVGAQLSYLISQLDNLAESPFQYTDKALWKEKISLLSDAGRNAMHTLRETIWAISHQELTLEEFIDRFKQYVIKMASIKSDIQVFFHEEICCQVKLTPSKALHMFRISQEAVHNSMKYSNAHQLDVYFILTKNLLFTIKIIDNGIGFNVHNSFKVGSYGLQNMKARAEEVGADLRIDSVIGHGTSVSVALKVEAEIMHM
jgi:signal transduction histidine kinase